MTTRILHQLHAYCSLFFSSMLINPKTLCFLLVFSFFLMNLQNGVYGDPQVPCYFIFGDSLSDNGNNNNLSTAAKANYLPYGIHFPSGPTGRFSDGRNSIDVIVQRLGFDSFIPSFATAKGSGILKGVNYASGSSGILDETGKQIGGRISLNKQISNHKITVRRITRLMGKNATAAAAHLNKCLYSVAIGSNDYILNYFVPLLYTMSSQYTPEQYADVLIQQYSRKLKALNKLGARKIALFGLYPLGCSPFGKSLGIIPGTKAGACSDKVNNAVKLFNDRLRLFVDGSRNRSSLTGANLTYINTYEIINSIFSSPVFKVTNESCCPRIFIPCIPLQTPCPHRDEYVFWDGIHFTDAAYSVMGERSYNAQTVLDVHPYDISHLVQL